MLAWKKLKIVCEEMNFFWEESDLKKLVILWNQGKCPKLIAAYFDREDPDEIIFAIVQLAKDGKIEPRKGGLFGLVE
jgi:hypothetical protein